MIGEVWLASGQSNMEMPLKGWPPNDPIDNSAEEEAVKDEAREFMTGLVGSGLGDGGGTTTVTTPSERGAAVVQAWQTAYANHSGNDLLDQLWSTYDPTTTSLWKMIYDEADYNETLDQTIEIVSTLLNQKGMPSMQKNCFAVIHTLESLEIEGLWLFNGPDPNELFGINGETSWYSWSQLGPEANDFVQRAVVEMLKPIDGKLHGRAIKDTKVFC